MNLTDITSVSISLSGPAPTAASFGNCLLLAYHEGPKLLESYSGLDELVADGFATTSPVYKMATELLSQTPKPPTFYVGRRDNAFSQTVDIAPQKLDVGYEYSFDLTLPNGTVVEIAYEVQTGDDADDVCIGLMAELGTQTGMTFTRHASTLTPVTPATLTGTVDLLALDVSTLNTKTFIVTSDLGGPFTTTFAGVATVDDIADQINAQTTTNATASIFLDGGSAYLRIESATVGATGTLLLGNGTANADLGFTNGQSATGTSIPGTEASITIAASAAGAVFDLSNLPLPGDMTIVDNTADPGIVDDITAIAAENSVDWYAVHLDVGGKATIAALQAWIEANEKVQLYTTSDSPTTDSGSDDDVMASLKALSYFRAAGLLCANRLQSYSALGWGGAMLVTPGFPGSATWVYRTIPGIAPDTLTSSQDHAVAGIPTQGTFGKNGSVYVTQNGVNITKGGRVAGGEWIDVIVGRDALKARIQESVFGATKRAADNGSKIPFTDDGIGLVQGAILQPLLLAEAPVNGASFLTPGSSVVTVPKAADVSTVDKQARRLTGVTFTAQIAGAIHASVITGTLTP